MAPILQFKRGALSNLPGLRAGEPALTTDTYDLYVGIDSTTNNNKFFGSHRYWTKETSSTGSGVRFVERTDGGSNYIEIKAPDTAFASNVTYVLPSTQGASSTVLTNDGSGNLSWGSGSTNAIFSGITTFSDTTDSTDKDTGAIIVEGGIGIEKSVNIGGNLGVTGVTTLGQLVTVNNGISASGFSTFYNLQIQNDLGVSGKIDVDKHIDVAQGAIIAGIVSFTDTTNATNKDSGAIRIDGGVGIDKDVYIGGSLNVSNNVSIGGTFVSIGAVDVYIENKDIILGYTTSVTPNDDTANHAGVAIASTEGSPLVSFTASGINTLPDTYKQLMWFKSGTLGFSTDAFAFNYGLAIGTTTMANGVRLAVGSGITMSDTEISATTFYGTLVGTVVGAGTSLNLSADTGSVNIDFDTETLSIAGTPNEIETVGAGNSITIGLPSTVNITTLLDVPTVEATNLKARDGTTAITITNGTGAVGFANSVTISGDLYVMGTTTEVNTSTLKVEDSLIDLGLVNDNGVLVPPTSDLNIDIGILLNWYDGSAKKTAVYWDDSVKRVGIASDVTELAGVLTANAYADVEIGSLWVTDCAGTSQVISCTGGERFLNNITVDAGQF
jgi:hypothetical protein